MKKILALIVAMTMCFSVTTTSFASETSDSQIDIPVLYFESEEEYDRYVQSLAYLPNLQSTDISVINASVVRSGNSVVCELYINYSGSERFSKFRYYTFTVQSTSILFPEVYETFGNNRYYTYRDVPDSATGSFRIGNLNIDPDVDEVYVKSDGLGAYSLDKSEWLNAVELGGRVELN